MPSKPGRIHVVSFFVDTCSDGACEGGDATPSPRGSSAKAWQPVGTCLLYYDGLITVFAG